MKQIVTLVALIAFLGSSISSYALMNPSNIEAKENSTTLMTKYNNSLETLNLGVNTNVFQGQLENRIERAKFNLTQEQKLSGDIKKDLALNTVKSKKKLGFDEDDNVLTKVVVVLLFVGVVAGMVIGVSNRT